MSRANWSISSLRINRATGLRLCLAIGLSLSVAACGYGFAGSGEHIDKSLQTVYVEPVVNNTSEPTIENLFRAAFIDWFIKGNRFQLVDREEQADVVWRSTISTLTRTPLSYQSSNFASEERMTVMLHLRFEERRTGKIVWTDERFTGTQDYRLADVNAADAIRRDALTTLSNYTAERAYRMMMSDF